MSPILAGVLQLTALVAALALAYRPLGDHMAAMYSSRKHLRVEKVIYRCIGADPDAQMRWPAYLRGVLAFSLAGVLFLYLLQRLQAACPVARLRVDQPGPGVQHGGVVRREHQLAVVQR